MLSRLYLVLFKSAIRFLYVYTIVRKFYSYKKYGTDARKYFKFQFQKVSYLFQKCICLFLTNIASRVIYTQFLCSNTLSLLLTL